VHICLRFNRDKISERCWREEQKLQTMERKDIRLLPRLNKLCSEERAVYCKVRAYSVCVRVCVRVCCC
jgi:Golgi apparatus protein 1